MSSECSRWIYQRGVRVSDKVCRSLSAGMRSGAGTAFESPGPRERSSG